MSSQFDVYNRRNIRTWLNDAKRKKGCSRKQVEYLRELNECSMKLSHVAMMAYWMKKRLGIGNCHYIAKSAADQKDFIYAAKQEMKVYRVDESYEKAFEMDIASLKRRADHARRICIENLRLTRYYPYFQQNGFRDFERDGFTEKGEYSAEMDAILAEAEKWNLEHPEIVSAHLESVQQEKETYEHHRQEVKERVKLEKQQARDAKKRQREEEKEILDNERKHRKRARKVEQSFKRYYG